MWLWDWGIRGGGWRLCGAWGLVEMELLARRVFES